MGRASLERELINCWYLLRKMILHAGKLSQILQEREEFLVD